MINRTSFQLLKLENLLRWSFFTFFNLWFSTLSPWLVPPDYDILSFQFFLSFLSTFIWNNSTFTIVRPFKANKKSDLHFQAASEKILFILSLWFCCPWLHSKICPALKLFDESLPLFPLPITSSSFFLFYTDCNYNLSCSHTHKIWSRISRLWEKAEISVGVLHFQGCAALAKNKLHLLRSFIVQLLSPHDG